MYLLKIGAIFYIFAGYLQYFAKRFQKSLTHTTFFRYFGCIFPYLSYNVAVLQVLHCFAIILQLFQNFVGLKKHA